MESKIMIINYPLPKNFFSETTDQRNYELLCRAQMTTIKNDWNDSAAPKMFIFWKKLMYSTSKSLWPRKIVA